MFFKENGQYRCAVYLRLSRSDGDQQESNSIKNQRALLNDYLGKHPELHKVDEYVDDGSGLLLSMMILTISGSRMWTVLQSPSRTW